MDAQLSGEQCRQIRDALLLAFPTRFALAEFTRFRLDTHLDAIADSGNLSEAVFQLVRWAESRGRMSRLIEAACAELPDNETLHAALNDAFPFRRASAEECSLADGKCTPHQNGAAPAGPSTTNDCSEPRLPVTITIETDLNTFQNGLSDQLMRLLANHLGTTDIHISSIREGSVKLTIDLPESAATKLMEEAGKSGSELRKDLEELAVKEVSYESPGVTVRILIRGGVIRSMSLGVKMPPRDPVWAGWGERFCGDCGQKNSGGAPVCWACGHVFADQIVGTCPRCAGALYHANIGALHVAACDGCGGLRLERESLGALCRRLTELRRWVKSRVRKPPADRSRKYHSDVLCPDCDVTMFQQTIGTAVIGHSVWTCPRCNTVFLDPDALEAIVGPLLETSIQTDHEPPKRTPRDSL